MVLYFNRKDLVSFGNYLLSKERRGMFEQLPGSLSVEERLKEVHHSDVQNWLELNQKSDKDLFTRERVIEIIDNLLLAPDRLIDAVLNEDTKENARTLLRSAE